MKTSIHITLLLSLVAVLSARAESHLNFLRQTQYDTMVVWDAPIDSEGSMPSPLGIGTMGSVFELLSYGLGTGSVQTLDREVISTYNPNIRMTFETGDPYQPVPRTRVDQPFTCRITISGMPTGIPNPYLREMLTTLEFVHQGFVFPSHDYSLEDIGGLNEPQIINQWIATQDAVYVLECSMSNLNGPDITKTFGVEVMTVSSPGSYNNGHGNNLDHTDDSNPGMSDRLDIIVMDEVYKGHVVGNIFEWAMVQVWPVAEASVEGIDPAAVYQNIPPITINLVDLYPDSKTYARAYVGPPSTDPVDPIELPITAIVDDSTPQDRTLVLNGLEQYLPESGSYTIEVIHETPFGTEILTQFPSLQVDYEVSVRGVLNSGE